MTLANQDTNKSTVIKRTVNKKEYIVENVFLGKKVLEDIIWTIAEKKTIREMGLVN
jgi:hypothetical protein